MNTEYLSKLRSVEKQASLKRLTFFGLPLLLWASAIFMLSNTTSSTLNESAQLSTRVFPLFFTSPGFVHVFEFGALYVLVYRFLTAYSADSTSLLLWRSLLIASAYGLIDEIHQSFVPGRIFSLSDVGIDVLGAITGLLLIWIWSRFTMVLKGRTQKHPI